MLPLEGLLVVSIEQAVAAPACTVRLADAGARVIKIERDGGETARHYDSAVKGTSAYFTWLNRGKESAVLDLKAEDDLRLLRRIIARADIFVQNLAPGATSRLGIAAADLVAEHPALIAVDIVGYGQDTPFRAMRAYDMLIQAESGICAVTGTAEEPVKVGVSIADVMTGMNAHAAILEALRERDRTGRGRTIEASMFDSMADMMSVPLLHYLHGGRDTPRTGLSHASIYPYGKFECRDGTIVIAIQNPDEWARFCRNVLQRPDLVVDPLYSDNPARVRNRDALAEILRSVFLSMAKAEAVERLEANRLAWSNVSTVPDLASHPALRRIPVQVPGGDAEAPGSPVRRTVKDGKVPGLGEHTDAVRAEFGDRR